VEKEILVWNEMVAMISAVVRTKTHTLEIGLQLLRKFLHRINEKLLTHTCLDTVIPANQCKRV
jgi:hypothetical protein